MHMVSPQAVCCSSVAGRFLTVSSAWAAITDNEHYVELAGLEQLVRNFEHKQEIIAGNLAEFIKGGG